MVGRNQAETSLKRYRYSGKERDDETGLYYYGARNYVPWMGRWLSCDPAGKIDSENLFMSLNNNPLSNIDHLGFQVEPPPSTVATASSVGEGLLKMKELGVQHNKEFGLVRVPNTDQLFIIEGGSKTVIFGDNIPLGHTHTGQDPLSFPSTADLEAVTTTGVSKHYIYGKDNGWGLLSQEAETGILKFTPEGGESQFITRNPNANLRRRKAGVGCVTRFPE